MPRKKGWKKKEKLAPVPTGTIESANPKSVEVIEPALPEPVELPSMCSCGKLVSDHSHCDACGITVGCSPLCDFFDVNYQLVSFRGHQLDRLCIRRWGVLERQAGHPISFEENLRGGPQKGEDLQ